MLAKFAAMEDALKTSMADVQASVTLVHTKLSTLTDQVRHSQFVFSVLTSCKSLSIPYWISTDCLCIS